MYIFNFGTKQIMNNLFANSLQVVFFSLYFALKWSNTTSRNYFSKLNTFVIKASSKKYFNNLYKNYKAKQNAYLLWDLRILLVFNFLRTCQAADDNCDERQQTMQEKREREKKRIATCWYLILITFYFYFYFFKSFRKLCYVIKSSKLKRKKCISFEK